MKRTVRAGRPALAIVVPLVLALVAACGTSGDDTLGRLREAGAVRVGFADEPPYAYLDDDGELVGSEVAIARTIFSQLGVDRLEPVSVPFDQLIPALEDGRVDVVVAGMFITPERCARVAFSNPTYAAPTVLAVPRGNPLGLTRYRDLLEAGGVVGVLAGSVEVGHAQGVGLSPSAITEFDQPADLVRALDVGEIDAFALTSLAVRSLRASTGDGRFDVTEPFIPVIEGRPAVGAGGVAFRLDDDGLRRAVDEELARLRASGELQVLVAPFGLGDRELLAAADLTTSELCEPVALGTDVR
ncbi:MAG: ectoine/hydroxyectoine ABC transporter substrate-binding protein EhuB [Chloroflexota bacterium]